MTGIDKKPDSGAAGLVVGRAIEKLARKLEQAELSFGHGAVNARDEAAWLVFAAADIEHSAGATAYDRPVHDSLWMRMQRLADERIRTRKPLAYLLNEAWFAGHKFYVDERVLVPRSPLAELIERGFDPWLAAKDIRGVLDIGTGSGCIAIAAAHAFPEARVVAVDISRPALEVAAMNVARHELQGRVTLCESDVFDQLDRTAYDLIISNPPYVDAEGMRTLPREYGHEPSLALAAGVNGLDCVSRILADAHNFLSDHGILVVEVGDSQRETDESLANFPFTWLEFSDGASGVFLLNRSDLPGAVNRHRSNGRK